MANFKIQNVRIQLKHDTAVNWATNSGLIPLSGEFCLDTTNNILKVGDGTNTFANLPTIGYVTEASAYSPYVNEQNPGNPGGKDATHGGIKVNGKDINVYTLNIATNSTLGGIKSGGDITINPSTGIAKINTITSSTGSSDDAGKLIRTNSNGLIDETFVMNGVNLIDPTTSKIYPIKLPIATVTTDGTDGTLGTIKVGDGLSIDPDNGTLSLGATTNTVKTLSNDTLTETEVVSKSTEYEGYYLECTTAGTSASSEPTISGTVTADSTTITDGTVTWIVRYGDTTTILARTNETAYSVGDLVITERLEYYTVDYSSAYVLNSLSI